MFLSPQKQLRAQAREAERNVARIGKEAERLWVESGRQMCKEDKARLLDESLVCRQQRDVAVKQMERLKEKIQKRLDRRNSLPLKSRL